MRKTILWLLPLLLALFSVPAMAEIYIFDELYASMEVPDSYTVLTRKNIDGYDTWLSGRGTSAEDTLADFDARGVLLQAWSEANDLCFELRAVQDERAQMIFDVNEQTTEVRGEYRTGHYPDNVYPNYEFKSSEWKNTANGRFLCLQYLYRDGGEVLHRGYMRRTIRNGYEIDFDMRVLGRSLTNKDNTSLNKIWDTFKFIEVLELPPKAAAKINITSAPPEESNEQSFAIEGTASEGVKLTAVTMGLSHPEPIVTEVLVGSNGKFSMPIHLPREGVFLTTITGEYQDQEIIELAYPVTYQRTLLAVNFTKKPPEVVQQDDLKITGTGEPGASIQVFVDGEAPFGKRVTAAGKFAVEVELKEEGEHEIILVFSKKGLADRRFTFHVNRKWTDADMMNYLRKQAISPTYSQLNKNIQNYAGRIMGYRAYIMDVAQSGEESIITMALSRKNGKYGSIVLVTAKEPPAFAVGERVMMYGTCEGMSLSADAVENDGGETSLPCFALLLLASLE